MDDRDSLAFYPFVFDRIPCRVCSEAGLIGWRLVTKFGPEIILRDLLHRFSYDCFWRAEARSKCGHKTPAAFICRTWNQPRPRDAPPTPKLVRQESLTGIDTPGDASDQ